MIQWASLYSEDATWEVLEDILKAYPNLHLEGKVFVEGKRSDRELDHDGHDSADGAEFGLGQLPQTRSKRNRLKPKWMRDYEVP